MNIRFLRARSRSLSLLVASVGLLAGAGCGPSINAAAKADIDRRAAAARSAQQYTAPQSFTPMPLQPGQWTQHKVLDDKQQPSFLTYKIVGRDGDAFWMEMVNETYSGRTITKLLMAIPNRNDINSVDIRAAATKDQDGQVMNFEGPLLQVMRGTFKKVAGALVINWQGLPQEEAAVTAGTFVGCFKGRSDITFGPWSTSSLSWSHPAVPLSGMVRSQGIDKPTTMELVAFGLTGATSEM